MEAWNLVSRVNQIFWIHNYISLKLSAVLWCVCVCVHTVLSEIATSWYLSGLEIASCYLSEREATSCYLSEREATSSYLSAWER